MTGPTPSAAREHWTSHAACRHEDGDLFFAADDERGTARALREAAAKAVCRACPVTDTCLSEALNTRAVGIWGGTSEDERRTATSGPCGTAGGRTRHKRNGEPMCGPCLAYERRRQEEVALRNWGKIQPLLAEGLTREQVADELGVNVHTVHKAAQAAQRASRRTAA